MTRIWFAVIVVVCVASNVVSAATVMTPYGSVVGEADQGVFAFRGIPYAKPPVGNLRFAAPEEVDAWNGTLNATKFAPGCMARCSPKAFPRPDIMCTPTTSEDCLYLNIFTPTLNTSANLPVIMFMHGGDFIGGSGGVPIYDGADLARNQNVVVVTINYRLGLIGALFTGTVKGNFQIQDQRQSMKWIQKAIASFGGNPELVTITGQSAGAASVFVHLTSPKSWPYFQRAISMSNPFSILMSEPTIAIQLGQKALEKLGCPVGGDEELACLRAANSSILQDLANTDNYFPWPDMILAMMQPWAPMVDGVELPYQPQDAIVKGAVSRVPTFFGFTSNESVMFIYDITDKPMDMIEYDLLMEAVFGVENFKKIKQEYGPLPPKYWGDAHDFLTVIATDYIFWCPGRKMGRYLTNATATYMYMFDQLGSWNEWVYGEVMPWCVNNVCHASDIPFVFNPFKSPSLPSNVSVPQPTEKEFGLSHFMQTAWGNFAKSGDPNTPTALPNASSSISFPLYNGVKNTVVNESIPVGMLSNYREKQCDFWDGIGYKRY